MEKPTYEQLEKAFDSSCGDVLYCAEKTYEFAMCNVCKYNTKDDRCNRGKIECPDGTKESIKQFYLDKAKEVS